MTSPWLSRADEILRMAEDLRQRGFGLEALEFALIAAQYLQVARALQTVDDLLTPGQ